MRRTTPARAEDSAPQKPQPSRWGGLRPSRGTLVPDLAAGATFAIVNVPQGMANAVLASVNPVAGLYTLIVAMPVGAVFTGSVFMNVSTTGALSVAAGEALADIPEDARLRALVLLVLMIGVVQLVFGLLRFGRLIRFVSHAVMTGFITGIAILIVLGSIPDLTGYRSPQGTHLLRIADTVLNWRILDPSTLTVGIATVILIAAFQRTWLRKFALILALACTTLLALLLAAAGAGDALVLVEDVAEIPRNLPVPILPDVALLPELLLPAVAIAIIGLVQGAGVGQSYPNPDGTFPDASRDFVGQGVANMAGSVFGAIPAGGSMSGTAVAVQAGAQSRWANIFAGLFIIVIIFVLVDVVKLVPMAGLGGLLLVVGLQNIQPAEVRLVWQTGIAAKGAMAATFFATLILPLQFAILVGVAISFLFHVLRSANRVEVRELVPVEGGFPVERPAPSSLETGSITVLRIRGSLFFASAQALGEQLPKASTASRAVVILSLRDMDDLGSTVIRLLKRYATDLERRGGRLILAGVNDELRGQLERTGFAAQIGDDAIFEERPEIGMALNDAILAARERIAAASVQDGEGR